MQAPWGGLSLLVHVLEREQTVSLDPGRVFQFFQRRENLGLVTPPWLRFKILSPLPIEVEIRRVIDYRIAIKGIPVRWRTLIEEYAPPYQFVDKQLHGPYAYWRHEHRLDSEAGAPAWETGWNTPAGCINYLPG
jgi:ligand-binding SRPBCC domain-containing protein